MNISLKVRVVCDQTGQSVELDQRDLGAVVLSSILKDLLKAGWSVSTWRNCYGEFSTHHLAADGWRIIQERADGAKREVRKGLNRNDIWVTAPGVEPNPPFTKSALIAMETQSQFKEPAVPVSRVKLLEDQVAYLTSQLQRQVSAD
ncbi:hypothetical protein U6G28_09020 [Actinomycetaceae bacterium MB13-C1-2]|nr:hypothetical protein U6G28_09020 [Actinomycetaceae bacterium MB13-C1-2]